jgi:catechol 2,3-dioxygenase-like lactoylglutathione lyase family enzyme
MITGLHSLIYSEDPEATRAFLSDVLGWKHIDAGGGWLIYKTPPSELGVHPTSDIDDDPPAPVPNHQLTLMCDDLDATIAELAAKGIEIEGEPQDQGFGITTSIQVPGAGWMLLYQPRHELAHALPD